jgi:carbon-monoxide dehydrogenase large subunit
MLPGPYTMQAFRAISYGVATNKVPIVPYRGVARPIACLATEMAIDAIAEAVGREPYAVRLDNIPGPEAMPFDNIIGKHFDLGDYPTCIRHAIEAINVDAVRARQKRGERDGRLIGVGFAFFNEQGAVGTSVYAKWGIPLTPGFEQATVRLVPDGTLELRVGIQSHGQGLETSLAQVAHEVLGIGAYNVKVVHGDTANTPYSIGTWGSRSMVMAGGAVAVACRELAQRIIAIAAHLLQSDPATLHLADGHIVSASRRIPIVDVAQTWYARPQELPADVHSGGLEVTAGHRPKRDSGTFSYATHAAVVAVDPETGLI